MIVTLSGENNFGLQAELQRLVKAFVAKHSELALERVDGEEADFAKIQESLTGLPMLAAKKLVVLRSPGKNKQFLEDFEQLLANLPETTNLVIVEPKLDKRLSYYKYLKKHTDFRGFPELDQADLVKWLTKMATEQGGSLGSSDARYMVERVGSSQELLWHELEKLLLYDSKINRRTIDLLTEPLPSSTVFQLLEAAFAGQHRHVLELYAEQRALKVEPQRIIAMLAWQLHVLAIIKTAGDRSADQIAKEAKLNPFVVRKSHGIARQLSLAGVKKMVNDLLKIDTKSKSIAMDLDDALQHYLLSLGVHA